MSDPVKQVAMRILDLREISDYTVDKMAEVLNVPVEEYRKYESGEVDIAHQLSGKDRRGISCGYDRAPDR